MANNFEISNSAFFKVWSRGNFRILLDRAAKNDFYRYQLQMFDGKYWFTESRYHTLEEAKKMLELFEDVEAME